MRKINITYMSGAGNLFTVFDDREEHYSNSELSNLAILLTSQNKLSKIDTEGLMILRNSDDYDFECLFYNPDGTTGMMCGNGGRAIIKYFTIKQKTNSKKFKFLMAGDVYNAELNSNLIDLTLPPVRKYKNIDLTIDSKHYKFDYIFNGSDHCVINVQKLNTVIEELNINEIGPKIRYNKIFGDKGANANFFEIKDNIVYLRTYERGVEKETGACGTGAIATAYSINQNKLLNYPINIIPTSHEKLIVDKDENSNMHLIGPAKVIDEDEIEIEL